MLKEQFGKLDSLPKITLQSPVKNQQQSAQPLQSSPSKLPSGAKVISNYLLGKNLGEGTFGKVHLAMHIPTGQKVAIKIIDKSKMRAKDIERVKCQIRILSTTRHRHLIHLYEILETEKSLLLVTEYMPNGELFRHIIKQKKIAEEQACVFFQQIVSAIEYLHNNGIAHRDLKPENILIDFDYQLKVIDFGLSTFYQKNQQLKTYCGSPCYAAPQIIEAKKSYNPLLADVWSCGVVLFAMLCGYLPFCDADTHTLYKKVMACSFKIPPHVSASARNLIQNLLVFAPGKRLSFQQIKSHEWFNTVVPAPSYGLSQYESTASDIGHVGRVKHLGFSEQKIVESLSKNERNKQTAAYFILMKKVVKEGVAVPSYIGNDIFNPKTIEKAEDKYEDDTHSLSDPLSAQIVIKIPQAPSMDGQPCEEGPNSQSVPDDWWDVGQREMEIKHIDSVELMSVLATNILDFAMASNGKATKLQKMKDILTPHDQESRIQKLVAKGKHENFYDNNLEHRKRKVNLHENVIKMTKQISGIGLSKNFVSSKRNIIKKTVSLCRNIREGTLLKQQILSELKKPTSRSHSKHFERLQSMLPYLQIHQNIKKNEYRFRDVIAAQKSRKWKQETK